MTHGRVPCEAAPPRSRLLAEGVDGEGVDAEEIDGRKLDGEDDDCGSDVLRTDASAVGRVDVVRPRSFRLYRKGVRRNESANGVPRRIAALVPLHN